jgi:hypothetical protein
VTDSNAKRIDDLSAEAILADSQLVEVRPDGSRVMFSPTLARLMARARAEFGDEGIAAIMNDAGIEFGGESPEKQKPDAGA